MPDLAILDIKMPRMDGMELLRRLRQKTDLPVIFLTSKDDEIDELFGLKMGADDFIKKPFSQRLLVERVKAVLRRFQPRDPAGQPKAGEAPPARVLDRGAVDEPGAAHLPGRRASDPDGDQFLILFALAHRPGVVKNRNALMDAAYDDQCTSTTAPSTATSSACQKFQAVDDDFDMIETLYGVGYRFKED